MAITTKNLTCIVCPRGCTLTVTLDSALENPVVSVEGQGCKRGVDYATAECTHPTRAPSMKITYYNRNIPAIKDLNNYPTEYSSTSNTAYRNLIKYGDLLFYLKLGENKIGLKKIM